MTINDLLALIPESPDKSDEALAAIESITTYPAENRMRIHVDLAHEFRLFVTVADEITIAAPSWKLFTCDKVSFLQALRYVIHEVDEAISEGFYDPPKPSPFDCFVFPSASPPLNMDLPVWDEKRKEWYDAEY
jgi:hypothetical protein